MSAVGKHLLRRSRRLRHLRGLFVRNIFVSSEEELLNLSFALFVYDPGHLYDREHLVKLYHSEIAPQTLNPTWKGFDSGSFLLDPVPEDDVFFFVLYDDKDPIIEREVDARSLTFLARSVDSVAYFKKNSIVFELDDGLFIIRDDDIEPSEGEETVVRSPLAGMGHHRSQSAIGLRSAGEKSSHSLQAMLEILKAQVKVRREREVSLQLRTEMNERLQRIAAQRQAAASREIRVARCNHLREQIKVLTRARDEERSHIQALRASLLYRAKTASEGEALLQEWHHVLGENTKALENKREVAKDLRALLHLRRRTLVQRLGFIFPIVAPPQPSSRGKDRRNSTSSPLPAISGPFSLHSMAAGRGGVGDSPPSPSSTGGKGGGRFSASSSSSIGLSPLSFGVSEPGDRASGAFLSPNLSPTLPYVSSAIQMSSLRRSPAASASHMSICGLPLPNSDFGGCDDVRVSIALGYTASLVLLLSRYLSVPLPYPVNGRGPFSSVIDQISDEGIEHSLHFSKSKTSKSRFEYAVFLINKDIEQLSHACGIVVSPRHLPFTLPNLMRLIASVSKAPRTQTPNPHQPPPRPPRLGEGQIG